MRGAELKRIKPYSLISSVARFELAFEYVSTLHVHASRVAACVADVLLLFCYFSVNASDRQTDRQVDTEKNARSVS